MQLYVVGQLRSSVGWYGGWDLQGVFDDYHLALLACKDGRYFIGPILLNQEFPTELVAWEGLHYPKPGNRTDEEWFQRMLANKDSEND